MGESRWQTGEHAIGVGGCMQVCEERREVVSFYLV